MKKLIIEALNSAYERLVILIPETKTQYQYKYIGDLEPIKMIDFLKENNIPDNCFFSVDEGGCSIGWEIEIPLTPNEKEKIRVDRFPRIAYQEIYYLVIKHGYKRIPVNPSLIKKDFEDTSIYEMYICGDFNRLVDYYSLLFAL